MLNVKVELLNDCKYKMDGVEVVNEVTYKDIQGFEVRTVEDEDLWKYGYDETDEYKEYLFIYMKDGEVATFRNSHVDMFRVA